MKRILIILLTINCSLFTINCSAHLQGRARIDSLLQELPKAKEDTNKCNLLHALSWNYSSTAPDTGILYGKQDSALATRLGWKTGIASALDAIGWNYANKSDYPAALVHCTEALHLFDELGLKSGMAGVSVNIGTIYLGKSDYPQALGYYLKGIKLLEEIGHKNEMTIVTANIAVVYQKQSDYPKALAYHFKALKGYEEQGNKYGATQTTSNIGIVYAMTENYPKALEFFFKALKMYEDMGANSGVARVLSNIGLVYMSQGDYPKALDYNFRALKIYEEQDNKGGVEICSDNIGTTYQKQRNYTQAVAWHFKALLLTRQIGNRENEAIVLSGIGDDFIGIAKVREPGEDALKTINSTDLPQVPYVPDSLIPRGRTALLHKAVVYINKAIAIQKEISDLDHLKDGYKSLSTADSLLGDYKGALIAKSLYGVYKDSVFSQENIKKIANIERERKAAQDSVNAAALLREQDIKATHRRNYELIGGGVIVLLLGFAFFITRNRNLLSREKQQSETLLLNILPEEVAAQLKDTGKSAAKQFDNVTVLFTDFVNFTEASERMKPEALIEELDTCFKAFDDITAKHNIEKIKTIGDAYLAVCGLPTPDPQHAENVVSTAKDINAFMQDRLAKMGSDRTFAVRIGIHSGSVVAGIVGTRKFAYDIWGDTVNTAARMEQNSEAGKINISQTTYELVKDKFNCEYRGEVEAKGKGVMKMYFVS